MLAVKSQLVPKIIGLFIAFVIFGMGTDQFGMAQQIAKPNVLMIAVDDLNDWIEPLGGHPQSRTPNIAKLAKRSVVFTNAHCQAPICNPSRISMLTGTMPATTGVYFLSPHLRQAESTKSAVTMFQHFSANGYRTVGGGKIFHVEGKGEFDDFGGRFGGFGPRPETQLNCRHVHPLWDWGPFPENDTQMPDSRLADWAVNQIDEFSVDQPTFLAVGFVRPHVPLYVPQKWFDMFPLEEIQLPAIAPNDLNDISSYAQDLTWSSVAPRHQWIEENNQWKKAVQAYLACTAFVDAQVGKVLTALEKSDSAENTIVVLLTDHGFHMGTKERWGKRSLWEASTKVPLMISIPGGLSGGTCNRPVGLIDLYPTLVETCNVSNRMGLEGRSLVRLLKNPNAEWEFPAITTFGQNNHAIRSQDFRYISYADGSEELYDHRLDPNEFNNIASKPAYKQVIQSHRRWLPQVNHVMAPGSAHLDARPGSIPDIDGEPFKRNQKK